MAGGVARDERPILGFSVRSDAKIPQWRGPRATAAPVFHEGLSCQPTRYVRQWQPLKDCRIEPSVKIVGSGEGRREFRVDDRVDENLSLDSNQNKLQVPELR